MKIALTKDGNTWEGIQKGICVDFFLNGKNRGITGCENLLFAQKELIDVVNKKIKEGFIFDKKMKIQFDNFKNKIKIKEKKAPARPKRKQIRIGFTDEKPKAVKKLAQKDSIFTKKQVNDICLELNEFAIDTWGESEITNWKFSNVEYIKEKKKYKLSFKNSLGSSYLFIDSKNDPFKGSPINNGWFDDVCKKIDSYLDFE